MLMKQNVNNDVMKDSLIRCGFVILDYWLVIQFDVIFHNRNKFIIISKVYLKRLVTQFFQNISPKKTKRKKN